LFNYGSAYDAYDDTGGEFGRARSVHSSHFQVLAETGFPGFAVWVAMFSWALWVSFRIRRNAIRSETLAPDEQRLFVSASTGLIASMVAFLVGGAFVAMALNDLTWISFALVAALDRLFQQAAAASAPAATETSRVRVFEAAQRIG
jgi:O-antigen ligase